MISGGVPLIANSPLQTVMSMSVEPRVRDGRPLRHRGDARRRRHHDRLDLAGFNKRHRRRERDRSQRHLAARHRNRRRPAALERDVPELDAGGRRNPLGSEMRNRRNARGGVAVLAGIYLRGVDQLAQGFHREIVVRDDDDRIVRNKSERNERRVQLERWRDDGIDRHVAVGRREQRVAVRRARRGGLHADVAAGAGAVLDENLLPPFLRQEVAKQARGHIADAARRRRHDDADRLRRERSNLRIRDAWQERNARQRTTTMPMVTRRLVDIFIIATF